jgi:hypothetical protein
MYEPLSRRTASRRLEKTSVRELEDTYFRWLDRTDEQVRGFFDEYATRWLSEPLGRSNDDVN